MFGTSRALAVGPVAVASLMTAAAVSPLSAQGTPEYLGAAIALALISGLMLLAMGLLRLGFLANFLSHPVISGFITASGIQIATGQIAPLIGVKAGGETFLELILSLGLMVTIAATVRSLARVRPEYSAPQVRIGKYDRSRLMKVRPFPSGCAPAEAI